jgi:hypothetical protein
MMPNKYRSANVRKFEGYENRRDLFLQLYDHCTVVTGSMVMLFTLKKKHKRKA